MNIKTKRLQEMLSDVSAGAVNLSHDVITQVVEVKLDNGVFELTASNLVNYITVKEANVEGENFILCVNCDFFSRLVSKFTCEQVQLSVQNNNLHIVGDGVYDLPVVMDASGPLVMPKYNFAKTQGMELQKAQIDSIYALHTASVGQNPNIRRMHVYYFGQKTITTDSHNMCISDFKLGDGTYSVDADLFKLVTKIREDKFMWYYNDGYFMFESPTTVVYGAEGIDKAKFPEQAALSLVNNKDSFVGHVVINKNELVDTLERMLLFVADAEKPVVKFNFNESGYGVYCTNQAVEEKKYKEIIKAQSFTCLVNVKEIKGILSSIAEDSVTLWYGNPKLLLFEIKGCVFGSALVSEAEL